MTSWSIVGFISLCICLSVSPSFGLQMCGQKLSDVLTLVCRNRGGFQAPDMRRADSSGIRLHKRQLYFPKEGVLAIPHRRSHVSPQEVQAPEKRPRGGVVDECCRNPCSYSTLESYCAADSIIDAELEAQILAELEQTERGGAPPSGGPLEMENSPESELLLGQSESQQELRSLPETQEQSTSRSPSSSSSESSSQSRSYNRGGLYTASRRPNIGLFSRNRPFFFVLSPNYAQH